MGGQHSGHINKIRKNSAYKTKVKSCRDSCRISEAEKGYEILVKKLEELERTANKTESAGSIEKDTKFSEDNLSRKVSNISIARDRENDPSTLKITCDDDAGSFKDFFHNNLCKLNRERCNEPKPHLHGNLNGVPIVLKLFDKKEEKDVRRNCSVSSRKETPLPKTRSPTTKGIPCDVINRQKRNLESAVDRQTSPMQRTQSSSTSPCSFSKEYLRNEDESPFAGLKCNPDHDCLTKCPPGDVEESMDPKNDKLSPEEGKKIRDKRSKEKKKGRDRRSKLKPPILNLKSEPLTDISAVPRHVWYGKNAYALEDDEPKPKNTFNSENTSRKNDKKIDKKTKINKQRGQEMTSNNFTVSSQSSVFRPQKIKEKNSNDVSSRRKREYLIYSVLLDENAKSPFVNCLKNIKNFESTSDVLRSTEIHSLKSSQTAFSCFLEKDKSNEKTLLRSLYENYDSLPAVNYFVAPLRIPNLCKIWHKKSKYTRRGSEDTDTNERNERTIIIARTAPPRSNGTLLMGAKTLITVRENAFPRRYIDNCGIEE